MRQLVLSMTLAQRSPLARHWQLVGGEEGGTGGGVEVVTKEEVE